MSPTGDDRADVDAIGVVLAGGGSTRFTDGDKALAGLAGEPLIAVVAATLERATGRPPVVAVRSDEQEAAYGEVLPSDVEFVRDADGRSGPLAGLLGAAESTSAGWLFVCGCDMPRLSTRAVRWVLDRTGDADAVAISRPDGFIEPLHAAYRRLAVLAARERLPADGGVHSLFSALASASTIPVDDAPSDVPLSASLSNVNTRDDLETVRDRLAVDE